MYAPLADPSRGQGVGTRYRTLRTEKTWGDVIDFGRERRRRSGVPALTRAAILAGALAVIADGARPATALTLDDAIQTALSRNERARAADMDAQAAAARVARARSFFFPDLDLRGDYTRRAYETTRLVDGDEVTIQSRNALSGRATLTQPILTLRALPALREAQHGREAARLDALHAKRLLAFETAAAFLATLGAQQVQSAADQCLDLANRSLTDARARFEAELVGSNDATRAELELASARREATRASDEAETSRLHLGFLVGADIADSLETPAALLADATAFGGDDGALENEAITRRQHLLSDRESVAALRSSAREATMRSLPELGFTGEYEVTNEAGLSDRDTDWSLGLGLTWRAFDGGERDAEHRERTALADAADLRARETERGIGVEVRSSLVGLENEQASIQQSEIAVDAARRNAAEAAELYRQGLATALEAIDANVQLFEAEVELARARLSLGLAFLDLRAALGLDPMGGDSL